MAKYTLDDAIKANCEAITKALQTVRDTKVSDNRKVQGSQGWKIDIEMYQAAIKNFHELYRACLAASYGRFDQTDEQENLKNIIKDAENISGTTVTPSGSTSGSSRSSSNVRPKVEPPGDEDASSEPEQPQNSEVVQPEDSNSDDANTEESVVEEGNRNTSRDRSAANDSAKNFLNSFKQSAEKARKPKPQSSSLSNESSEGSEESSSLSLNDTSDTGNDGEDEPFTEEEKQMLAAMMKDED